MMSQLLVVAAMCAALVFAARRWFKREVARVDDEMRRTQRSLARARNGQPAKLRFDAETGHYYPVAD
ncbi:MULTISPECIES: hypothetical protein [Rhodomicrobium]|uniref:hypothetical protein n=1 Tax=Rhodomicrobium TaxID=1068 RepID=UPI000F73EDA3|nr:MULTISPECIES: hypothetical protein [Rhodomicrobium]